MPLHPFSHFYIEPTLCFYVNKSKETQIVRLPESRVESKERILRPNEHWLFEASSGAILEIYTLTVKPDRLLYSITCKELKISYELIEQMLHWLS